MAAVISSYPIAIYHQQINPLTSPYYGAQYIANNYRKSKPQKQLQPQKRSRTPTPTKASEYVDLNIQPLRPRREPRIHRQVIVLPAPEPIYRQVRHRLPTPERQVIHRVFLQRANGDVIVQQERHRKKTRSHSRPYTIALAGSPRGRQVTTD